MSTGIDVKIATAMLDATHVIFVTERPTSIDDVTIIESRSIRLPTPGRTFAQLLNHERIRTGRSGCGGSPRKSRSRGRSRTSPGSGVAVRSDREARARAHVAHASANSVLGAQ